MRFAFIRARKAEHSISALCRVLDVTRQGYYRFEASYAQVRAKRELERELGDNVRAAYDESRGTYGSPRVHEQLKRQGVRVSKRRIERTMRGLGLVARRRRRFTSTTRADISHRPASNVLNREFSASRPNERWVTDITYVWTDEGWAYVAVIIDLFSRSVVGWALDASLGTRLPLAALNAALVRQRPGAGLLHHSDRGCQYTSAEYRNELAARGITVSMSRKGNCWDNAVAESFFATLKAELINERRWATRVELRAAVFEYIESFYNRRRLHSSLGYRTPAEVEQQLAAA
jgi:transposase InsO family protein